MWRPGCGGARVCRLGCGGLKAHRIDYCLLICNPFHNGLDMYLPIIIVKFGGSDSAGVMKVG